MPLQEEFNPWARMSSGKYLNVRKPKKCAFCSERNRQFRSETRGTILSLDQQRWQTSQRVVGEFPLRVINEASLCGALQEAASNSAFRRENIADVFDGVSFVRVELEGRQREDISGPGLVQVECRADGCGTACEVSMSLSFLPITCASRPGFCVPMCRAPAASRMIVHFA
jgi:hypothetical protein